MYSHVFACIRMYSHVSVICIGHVWAWVRFPPNVGYVFPQMYFVVFGGILMYPSRVRYRCESKRPSKYMGGTFPVVERGTCLHSVASRTRAGVMRATGQLTKFGRRLGELPRAPERACQWDGRIKLLKTLHFKTICPTQGCTTPIYDCAELVFYWYGTTTGTVQASTRRSQWLPRVIRASLCTPLPPDAWIRCFF